MLKLIREASKTYHQFQQLGPQFLDTFDQRPITEATMEAIKTKQLQEYIRREFKPIGEISMLPIHSEPNHQFTIALFAIMAGTMMPLHDHPNMFVLTHVMSGVGERESWDVDLEDLDKQNKFRNNRMVSQFVKAKENERVQLTEGVNCFTTPNKHNLHRFINKSPRELFVFLDVILPHYNEQDRVISFYEPVSKNELQMLSQPRQYTRHPIKDIDIQEFLVQ